MTTYVNLCWVMGHFLSSGVLIGAQTITTQWRVAHPMDSSHMLMVLQGLPSAICHPMGLANTPPRRGIPCPRGTILARPERPTGGS